MPKVTKNKVALPLEEAAPQPMDLQIPADLEVSASVEAADNVQFRNQAQAGEAQTVEQPETDAAPLKQLKFPPISAFDQNGKKLEFRRV